MSDTYRRGAHTVFEIHLHLVWVTKYRRAALSGEVGTRVRELIREICAQEGVVQLDTNSESPGRVRVEAFALSSNPPT